NEEYKQTGNEKSKIAAQMSQLILSTGVRSHTTSLLRPENFVIVENGKATFHFPEAHHNPNRSIIDIIKKKKDEYENLPDGVYINVVDKGSKFQREDVLKKDEHIIKKMLADHYANPENRDKKGRMKDVPLLNVTDENGKKVEADTI